MKRLMVTAFALLIAASALAQERRMLVKEPSLFREGTAAFLQLTDAQKSAWQGIQSDLETALQPLIASNRDLERKLEPLAKAGDACGIGSVWLQMQSIREQIFAARKTAEQKAEALLTPDQKAKYNSLRD